MSNTTKKCKEEGDRLHEIVKQAEKQLMLYKQGQPNDPKYSFQLFTLALRERNDHAWELLYRLYRPDLENFAKEHLDNLEKEVYPIDNCHIEDYPRYFVDRGFERMYYWARKSENFDKLSTLP